MIETRSLPKKSNLSNEDIQPELNCETKAICFPLNPSHGFKVVPHLRGAVRFLLHAKQANFLIFRKTLPCTFGRFFPAVFSKLKKYSKWLE